MRAELRGLHCPDIDDLEHWSPGSYFGVFIQIMVGPVDGKGEESFGVTVCSPSWFAAEMGKEEIRSGHHTIFMREYNYEILRAFIERAIHRIEAPTWKELAEKLSWLGHWEFDDYKPYGGQS